MSRADVTRSLLDRHLEDRERSPISGPVEAHEMTAQGEVPEDFSSERSITEKLDAVTR